MEADSDRPAPEACEAAAMFGPVGDHRAHEHAS